jgi:hypothetical protein
MTDYAAVPVQPIVQGVLTVDPISLLPTFQGRGVLSVVKNAVGDFTLNLDPNSEGSIALDATVTPSVPAGVAGAVPVFGRTILTLRGSPTNVVPFSTTITEKSVSYVVTDPTKGATAIRIVLAIGGAGTDPTEDDAGGCEVIVLRANTRGDNFSQTIFGPLFGGGS